MLKDRRLLLIKLDRFCAWLLIGVILAFFTTGYGMTKGLFIQESLAKFIHDDLLPVMGISSFALHSAYGMHIAFKRWKIWGPALKVILIVYAVSIVTGVIVVQFVRPDKGDVQMPQVIELE